MVDRRAQLGFPAGVLVRTPRSPTCPRCGIQIAKARKACRDREPYLEATS